MNQIRLSIGYVGREYVPKEGVILTDEKEENQVYLGMLEPPLNIDGKDIGWIADSCFEDFGNALVKTLGSAYFSNIVTTVFDSFPEGKKDHLKFLIESHNHFRSYVFRFGFPGNTFLVSKDEDRQYPSKGALTENIH